MPETGPAPVLIAAAEDATIGAIAAELPRDRYSPIVARGWAQVMGSVAELRLRAAIVHYVLEDCEPMAFCGRLRALESFSSLPLILLLPGIGRAPREGEPFDVAMQFPVGPGVLSDNLRKVILRHDTGHFRAVRNLEAEVSWRMTEIGKKTYYEILGISPSATRADIVKAYDGLSLRFHPDRLSAMSAEGAARAMADQFYIYVTEAYQVLSKAESRRRYDASLTKGSLRLEHAEKAEEKDLMDVASNASARRYVSMAKRELSRGKVKNALMLLDMACSVDPQNMGLKRRVERLRSEKGGA